MACSSATIAAPRCPWLRPSSRQAATAVPSSATGSSPSNPSSRVTHLSSPSSPSSPSSRGMLPSSTALPSSRTTAPSRPSARPRATGPRRIPGPALPISAKRSRASATNTKQPPASPSTAACCGLCPSFSPWACCCCPSASPPASTVTAAITNPVPVHKADPKKRLSPNTCRSERVRRPSVMLKGQNVN